ncbi:MAG: CesT family type III secretion system chaperone [Pseudomonadota bacterium]
MNAQSDHIETTLHRLGNVTLTREGVEALLADYAQHIGVEGLELDEHDVVEFSVDEVIDVALMYLPHLQGLIAVSPVAEQDDATGSLGRRLLQANQSWSLTRGGVFARLPGRPELMLCSLICLPSDDLETLDRDLAAFVHLVKLWREETAGHLDGADAVREDVFRPPDNVIRV